MQRKLRIMFFLIASILAVQTSYAASVTITDLGTLPGGSNSCAYDINDKGQIVGSSNDAYDYSHAFLWQNGVMTDLDLGGSYSYANGINDNGQIVGYGNNTLLWQNGVITDLETLSATDINDKGQIVGSSSNLTDLCDHAVLWQNGVITDLETNGWECSYANGINDNGQIVGYTHIMATASEAFLWQNGVMTYLETLPGGDHSKATDINDNGQIVGSSNNADSNSHAVLWQNGVITDLDPSGSYSKATDINDNGQIVGSSNNADSNSHAVLWQNGVITDLGTLPGDSNSYATSINNNGQIVGYSYNTYNDGHAVLWTVTETPVPPKASFTSNVTNGNVPLTVQFTDLSQNTTGWNWNFGDKSTSTSKSPTHKYTKAGKYTVSLTVKNAAGTNTKTKTNYITVTNPVKPVATFSAYPTSGKAPLTVKFTDKSTGSPTSWSWSFGDKSTSTVQNPVHKYTKAGKYTVSLTVKNAAGTNTKTKTNYIKVVTKPVAAFSATPISGKAPLNVKFTDTSTGIPAGWKWNFGDGSKAFHQNPTHKYSKAGIYTVSLTVKNAKGNDTVTKTGYIKVVTKPVAAFSATPTSGKVPLKVQFTDKSTGVPTSWKWSFGDGTYSTAKNLVHKYSKAGKYTVSLTVKNAASSNTAKKTSFITVK